MSDDWQPGDLAWCISRADSYPPAVQRGSTYTVRAVWADIPDAVTLELGICLDFVGIPRHGLNSAYSADRFRKIRAHEADDEDRETIRLLTGQPEPAEA